MKSKHFAILTVVLVASVLAGFDRKPGHERPNFVWIVSEDNSVDYLRAFADGGAATPNIEALAASGLTFENAFSNAPVCSAARTTLATSTYAPRIGAQYHRRNQHVELPAGIRLFHSYLKDAGYYTSNRKKTDYNVNAGKKPWDDSSASASWRKRPNREQPFFHFQTTTLSHESSLHFSREEYRSRSTSHEPDGESMPACLPDTKLSRYTLATYLDRMQDVDRVVGDVIAQLEEDGLLEDTFIFYFGDNGGVLPRSKGYAYDPGLHVPFVVRIPENFAHLVDAEPGTRVSGFVNFVDFGPTVLALAGVDIPAGIDGQPFLGADTDMGEVNARDESLGYADRMDEKYDFVRSLRKGRYRYVRSYTPYLPDGLQNNYRYRMLAYQEWRELWKNGELDELPARFFAAKPVEALFDAEADPQNCRNLAGDPGLEEVLADLRQRLDERLRDLPDLGFYPESHLAEHGAFEAPIAFGAARKDEIAALVATADLALLPWDEARPRLLESLRADNAMVRLWAVTAAASFGKPARDIEAAVAPLAADASEQVRIRVADYLGVTGAGNPQALLASVINTTSNPVVAAEALNSVVFFNDFFDGAYPADIGSLSPPDGRDVQRRMEYLRSIAR